MRRRPAPPEPRIGNPLCVSPVPRNRVPETGDGSATVAA
jgi:hypothetical protein